MTDIEKPDHMLGRSALDRLFFRIATTGWRFEQISTYLVRLRKHNKEIPPEIIEAFAQIDAKATGLLTHVSLMIAGLGLVAPLVAQSDFEIGVVVAEIAVYLLIAVGSLRCLSIFNSSEFDDDAGRLLVVAESELIIRRELYALCIRAAIVFTIIVFLLLPLLFFYKPGQPA
jgi:hypothetical protein